VPKPVIQIGLDDREFAAVSKRLGSRLPAVGVRALNRTIRGVHAEASRLIRAEINIPANRVRRDLHVRRASAATLTATLLLASKPTPLIVFKARATRRGVTYQIEKDEGRKLLRGAFIATMASGHTGVFSRHAKKVKKRVAPDYHGLSIFEHKVPALGTLIADEGLLTRLAAFGSARLQRELKSQVEFELSKT